METISQTRSYCTKCSAYHEAFYRQDGDNIFFTVDCPKGAFQHLVSDDAALFRAIREKAGFDQRPELLPHQQGKKRFHMLGITNRCNFRCNICYAAANTEQDILQLTPEDIFRLAPEVKKAGGHFLTLSGGEPTMHPDLFEIIKGLRARGLRVTMATNGYKLGIDKNYAAQLKASGLNLVTVSFDTLDKKVHQLYRNNTYIAEKTQALENARAAGLRASAIVTMTKYNIAETGAVVKFLAGFAPAFSGVALQPYFYTINPRDNNALFNRETVVRREEIINHLVRSGEIAGLTADHFRPFPQLGMTLHPDCAAFTMLTYIQGKLAPLDVLLDTKKYYARLGSGGNIAHPLLLPLLQIKAALQSARQGRLLQVLKCFYGYFTGRGDHSLVFIMVEGFMDAAYQDDERARLCPSLIWQKEGKLEHLGCLSSLGIQQEPEQQALGCPPKADTAGLTSAAPAPRSGT